jgi:hypothetical protein
MVLPGSADDVAVFGDNLQATLLGQPAQIVQLGVGSWSAVETLR